MEAVEAHNAGVEGDKPEAASPEFRDFMKGMFKGNKATNGG